MILEQGQNAMRNRLQATRTSLIITCELELGLPCLVIELTLFRLRSSVVQVNAMTTNGFGRLLITKLIKNLKRVFSMKMAWIRIPREIQANMLQALVTELKQPSLAKATVGRKLCRSHLKWIIILACSVIKLHA